VLQIWAVVHLTQPHLTQHLWPTCFVLFAGWVAEAVDARAVCTVRVQQTLGALRLRVIETDSVAADLADRTGIGGLAGKMASASYAALVRSARVLIAHLAVFW